MCLSQICKHFCSFNKFFFRIGFRNRKLCKFNKFLPSAAILRKINESYCLENASKLAREFLYDILKKKILINFLVKNVIQKLVCQF